MSLRIFATGGTFDKHYNELSGSLGFAQSYLPAIVARCRIVPAPQLEILPLMDSLDMQEADRARILARCRQAYEMRCVIIHGTDTMPLTAQYLGEANLAKTIVLTGAMVPYEMTHSDALFNLGVACGAARILPQGVYIAMNGQLFDWQNVEKNRALGIFQTAKKSA